MSPLKKGLNYNKQVGICLPIVISQITSFCITTEHLIPCYALVVAYGNACAVNETYTRASAKAKQLKEQHHLNRDSGLEFNKAII